MRAKMYRWRCRSATAHPFLPHISAALLLTHHSVAQLTACCGAHMPMWTFGLLSHSLPQTPHLSRAAHSPSKEGSSVPSTSDRTIRQRRGVLRAPLCPQYLAVSTWASGRSDGPQRKGGDSMRTHRSPSSALAHHTRPGLDRVKRRPQNAWRSTTHASIRGGASASTPSEPSELMRCRTPPAWPMRRVHTPNCRHRWSAPPRHLRV